MSSRHFYNENWLWMDECYDLVETRGPFSINVKDKLDGLEPNSLGDAISNYIARGMNPHL